MTASLGGLDALVFTAGIGEHSMLVRARLCERLRFLGVELDAPRNTESHGNQTVAPDRDSAAVGSPVRVLVVRAREELVVASAVRGPTGSTATKPDRG